MRGVGSALVWGHLLGPTRVISPIQIRFYSKSANYKNRSPSNKNSNTQFGKTTNNFHKSTNNFTENKNANKLAKKTNNKSPNDPANSNKNRNNNVNSHKNTLTNNVNFNKNTNNPKNHTNKTTENNNRNDNSNKTKSDIHDRKTINQNNVLLPKNESNNDTKRTQFTENNDHQNKITKITQTSDITQIGDNTKNGEIPQNRGIARNGEITKNAEITKNGEIVENAEIAKNGEIAENGTNEFREHDVTIIEELKPYAVWFFAHKCELEKVCSKMEHVPHNGLPQVAFVGRSNAGKSSLLNALISSANGKLARVSGNPGCTQTINFYNLYQRLMLLDLPGYGYAKVPQLLKRGWLDFIAEFLSASPNLKRTFVLIDSRRGVTRSDHEFMEQLEELKKSFQIVLTKMDKPSQKGSAVESVMREVLIKYKYCVPGVLVTSAAKKFGLAEVKACCLHATGLGKNRVRKFEEKMAEREMEQLGI
eukprot:Phypoly_transcript_08485.p1 GENE.Phypoly_transcript_08485~~Phypoly_transcript_08485.p1  ORF type:complete len:478 (+),score=93.46 Phypoly_transcript_08485:1-1434(+)